MIFKHLKFKSVNSKLVFLVLFISTIFTTIATGVNFYLDYKNEKEQQLALISQIEKSSVKSITKAVWDFDISQVERNVDGLVQLRDILSLKVVDQNMKEVYSNTPTVKHERALEYSFTKSYTLKFLRGGVESTIGYLDVNITNYYLYEKLVRRMGVFFVTQGLKSITISFILLLCFNFFVTRHLMKMAKFCAGFKFDEPELLELDKKTYDSEDEFDLLCASFNKMIMKIEQSNKKLYEEILKKESAFDELSRLATIGEMAGNIGHEINNPLTIFSGYTQVLRSIFRDEGTAVDRERILGILEKEDEVVKRISTISTSLSLLSRSPKDLESQVEKLNDIFTESISLFSEKSKSASLDFSYALCDDDVSVKCNRIQLNQVIMNLLSNALYEIKGSDNAWIKLETSVEGNNAVIKIIDSGKGIDPKVVKSIFLPFFTTKVVGEGTGLGLSICFRIIKSHDGTLEVDQTAENTTFKVSLPIES